jgi:hypothetical protein
VVAFYQFLAGGSYLSDNFTPIFVSLLGIAAIANLSHTLSHGQGLVDLFTGPLVPDGDVVVVQIGDVGVALQEPQQFMDDGA